MLCPRCHTELPDSAAICSQCGMQVSAANPIRSQSPTFSYLPPGTPQWPNTVLPTLPYPPQGGSAGYPQAGYAPDASPAAKERPARKPGSLSLPMVFLLFIASILVGGGLTYGLLALQGQSNNNSQPLPPISLKPAAATTPTTTTLTPTPNTGTSNQLPTPTSFQKANSPDLAFSMSYPSDWVQDQPQQSTSGNKDIAFHPQQQLPVYLQVGQISAANSATVTSASDVNQANLDGFGTNNGLTNPQVLTNTPTTRSIGSASWSEEDIVFSASSGDTYHIVSLTVKHSKYYYNILYFAPTTAYDEAMSKYYTQMLSSFQFTS